MRERTTALAVALGLAVAAMACGGGESGVVNRYFNALNANDTSTLSSFAAVRFDKKVDAWKIVSVGPETKGPATLPDLVAKHQELASALAENRLIGTAPHPEAPLAAISGPLRPSAPGPRLEKATMSPNVIWLVSVIE